MRKYTEAKLTGTLTPVANVEPLLDLAILNISQLDSLYENGTIVQQRKIIGPMFPEKLTFYGFEYRTARVNEALAIMLLINKKLDIKKKKKKQVDHLTTCPKRSPYRIRTGGWPILGCQKMLKWVSSVRL